MSDPGGLEAGGELVIGGGVVLTVVGWLARQVFAAQTKALEAIGAELKALHLGQNDLRKGQEDLRIQLALNEATKAAVITQAEEIRQLRADLKTLALRLEHELGHESGVRRAE